MKFALLVAFPVMIASIGCSTIAADINSLPDDALASYVEGAAKEAAILAIQFATWKDPSKATQIKKDAIVGDQVIRQTLYPAFQNAPLGTVLVSAISVARQQLQSQLSGSPIDTLVLVVSGAVSGISIPSSGYLSPRHQKAVAAGFLGTAEGIELSVGIPALSAQPQPPQPPQPPATPPK